MCRGPSEMGADLLKREIKKWTRDAIVKFQSGAVPISVTYVVK